MSDQLTIAINAAKEGGKIAMRYYQHHPAVSMKANHTPVTIADKSAEKAIRAFIFSQDKTAQFFGEEQGGEITDAFWTIDPIDGTNSYIRGIPHWGVLLSYIVKKEVVLGVSLMPENDELLYAEKGKGAFLNDRRVHVSKVKPLGNSYITFGNFKYITHLEEVLTLEKKALAAKGMGDAYSYHLLANGNIDAHMEEGFSLWDVAQFKVITEEAGGRVTTVSGKEWQIDDKTILASNGLIHDEIVEIINKRSHN